MNSFAKAWALAAAAAFAANIVVPVSASQIPNTVSGTVTAPVIGHEIKVDGVTYQVRPSGDTYNALSTLKVGDHVDLLLNAPPASKGAAVTRITAHPSAEQ